MNTFNPSDRLAESYPGASSPPPAADGGPVLEPALISLPVIAPISRCELGPCRNYHAMTSRLDAASPLDGGDTLHTTTTRSCYPSPGVVIELDGEPVHECTRWDPMSHADRLRDEQLEQHVACTERGQRELAEFHASWAALNTTT